MIQTTMINQELKLPPILHGKVEFFLHKAMKIENAIFGAVQIYNPLSKSLQLVHQYGLEDLFVEPYINLNPASDTVCSRAFRMASSIMIAEVEADFFFKRFIESGGIIKFKSLHCSPIFSQHGEVIGILNTYYNKNFHLNASALEIKSLVAAEIAPIFEDLINSHSKKTTNI